MRKFTFFKVAFTSALFLFLFNFTSFAQCAISEDFESSFTNPSYSGRVVTLPSGNWLILGWCNMDANDRYLGTRSVRLRANNSDTLTVFGLAKGSNVIQMESDKTNGVGTVSFYYGSYSGHSGGIVSVEYSTDGGTTWIKPENNSVTSPTWAVAGNEMKKFTVDVNVTGNIRVRVIKYKQAGTQNSVNVDNICVTDYACENCVVAPVFDPPGGNQSGTINVKITSTTAGATIRYTLDGNDPNESSTVYSNAIMVDKQTTIKAKAWKDGMDPSSISTAIYNYPQAIGSLAALRAAAPPFNGLDNPGTTVFKYTGKAVVTQVQPYQNTIYIQEGNAAIMIWDPQATGTNPSVLHTKLYVGDRITDLYGTVRNYFGMLRFIPIEGECTVIEPDQQVMPVKITAADLDFKHDNPAQAKLITIENVSFVQTGNFATGRYYNLKQGTMVYDSVFYTDNFDADYIGKPIPTIITSITGVCNFKGSTGVTTKNRIIMLNTDNQVAGINDFNKSVIKLSPNPANSYVNIITESPTKLEIYSLLGNLIAVDNLSEGQNTVPVSNYPAGVYILKMTDANTGQSYIQKLIIK
jgi:hypothetical protein